MTSVDSGSNVPQQSDQDMQFETLHKSPGTCLCQVLKMTCSKLRISTCLITKAFLLKSIE